MNDSKKNKTEEMSFEQGLGRLDELIEQLEDGEIGLERSLEFFEEGIKLSRVLNKKLDQAEKKLEILLKDEEGRLSAQPFDLEPDEE